MASSYVKVVLLFSFFFSFVTLSQNIHLLKSYNVSNVFNSDGVDTTICSSVPSFNSNQEVLVKDTEHIDTAIIISSSWIPTHPSTKMIETVINSTALLIGLPPSTPIFITIDTFVHGKTILKSKDDQITLSKKLEALEEYANKLFEKYLTNPRVYVLPGMSKLHIGGSVYKAVNLIEHHFPSVQYLYYLQHDFYFVKNIDHKLLVDTMKQFPIRVNYVRFLKRLENIQRKCGNETEIILNHTRIFDDITNVTSSDTTNDHYWSEPTQTLSPSSQYSDNNHFVRFKWYKETLGSLMLDRPPEFPLMNRGREFCEENKSIGLWNYDNEVSIVHLDGRNTQVE